MNMKKNVKIFDYLADASAYITILRSLAEERTWMEPSDDFFKEEFWEDYVDSIVKDGLKVGQPGYLTDTEDERMYA